MRGLTDKIEPKFKVGDWVFIEEIKGYKQGAFQIKSIDEFGYNFDEYHIIPLKYEELLSKWSIEDAKDGDVLYDGSNACLFRKKMEDDDAIWVDTYCGINSDGMFKVNNEDECWCLACDCTPATKEQRDTLMKAMTDARYTFGFEKKELKKIIDEKQIKKNLQDNSFRRMFEQKPAEDSCKNSDDITTEEKDMTEYKKGFECGKQRVLKYPEDFDLCKKTLTVWSEEDESRMDNLCHFLEEYGNQYYGYLTLQGTISWLKSLRPHNNITDEELAQAKKNAYNDALDKIEYHSGEPTFDDGWSAAIWYLKKRNTLLSDLKKLREE